VHERGLLGRFREDGLDVVDVSGAEDGAGATAEAIRGGAGVGLQVGADQSVLGQWWPR
jgi:hypothetical protein